MDRNNSDILPIEEIELLRVEYDKNMNAIQSTPVKGFRRGRAIMVPVSSIDESELEKEWWAG